MEDTSSFPHLSISDVDGSIADDKYFNRSNIRDGNSEMEKLFVGDRTTLKQSYEKALNLLIHRCHLLCQDSCWKPMIGTQRRGYNLHGWCQWPQTLSPCHPEDRPTKERRMDISMVTYQRTFSMVFLKFLEVNSSLEILLSLSLSILPMN